MKKTKIENYPMVSPTPIVLVGTTVGGRANYAAVGAFGVVCLAPLFYVSLKSTHHSVSGIRENGFFSVNLPSAAMLQKTDYCGMVSGAATDKSALFSSFYDELGKAPMIGESPMNYLCKVVKSVPVNDFEVFFGEIVATYVNEDCLTEGKPDPLKADPILAMGPAYYTLGRQIGRVFQEGKA
ncbi:MAG: flavin reductase family protein [Clostridiales bacterium]|nr:flavin reductase family protein [Clostridiales bacterium]